MSERGFLPESPARFTETAASGQLSDPQLARRLAALLSVASQLRSSDEVEQLCDRVVELAVGELGAERGLVFLVDPDSGELTRRAAHHVDDASAEDALECSRRVLRQVESAGTPVLCPSVQDDSSIGSFESVRDHGLSSLVCVPLIARGRVLGTLYVDTRDPARSFGEDDVAFLLGFADLAAVALENAELAAGLLAENASLRSHVAVRLRGPGLVGESREMRRVLALVDRVVDSDVTVLIEGETGTGKELVARAIHTGSARKDRPLVTIDCGALPVSLAESEFFGHRKGAFTDARRDRPGLIERASGGTLFIDEVGDVSLELQAKLLRFLQEGEVRRIGDTRPTRVDARVIAATNRDLMQKVEEGRFRRDLYYRLNVVSIPLPPLRDRVEDIALLSRHFLARMAKEAQCRPMSLSPATLELLEAHDWPGNVRELENTLRRAVVLADGENISPVDLGENVRGAGGGHSLRDCEQQAATRAARQLLVRALEQTGGDVARVAELVETPLKTVYYKLKRLGISPRSFRPDSDPGNSTSA